MNLQLKMKILEKFGSQWSFAKRINIHESYISQVIRGKRILSPEKKDEWARILKCKIFDIF